MVRQRVTRKDPDQEAILRGKDEINERTTRLIKLLIELKRGWNGNPAPDIGVPEKYNLTDPLPSEVTSYGDKALQELSEIIHGLHSIDSMQDSYSDKRNQRINERMSKVQEIQQQAAVQAELLKVGSNPLTRAWAHVVAPFQSDKGKWDRLRMLRALARINESLKEVEDKVLSGDPAILDSLYEAKQLWLDAKGSFFEDFRKNLTEMFNTTSGELKSIKENIDVQKANAVKEQKQMERDLSEKAQTPLVGVVKAPQKDLPKAQEVQKVLDKAEQKVEKLQEAMVEVQQPLVKTRPRVPIIPPVEEWPKEVPPEEARQALLEPVIQQRNQMSIPELLELYMSGTDKEQENLLNSLVTEKRKELEAEINKYENLPDDPEESPEDITPLQQQEPEQVEIPNPPEEVHPPDPRTKQIALRKFIIGRVTLLYNSTKDLVSETKGASEPWGGAIKSTLRDVNSDISSVTSSKGDRAWYINYLNFVRKIGLLQSIINRAKTEISAAQVKPDFKFGTSYNMPQIENEANNFVKPYQEELNKFISNPQLVSQASTQLSRWLKRMKTHLVGGRDKSIRLQVTQNIRSARDGLQSMMNNLEKKHINFRQLIGDSSNFYDSIIQVYDKLADLGDAYNARMRVEKSDRKIKKDRMPYDLIPTTDIGNLRSIRNALLADKDKIDFLGQAETAISNLHEQLRELKEPVQEEVNG